MLNRRNFLLALLAASAASPTVRAKQSRSTGIVLDEHFVDHLISSSHPESPGRYLAIVNALEQQDWSQSLTRLAPLRPGEAEPWLQQVHSQSHIDSIKQDQQTYNHALLATSACLSAVDSVMQGRVKNAFCASRPPGHHAVNSGQEEGFCYFNHIAVAARYAQHHYKVDKVLIIDWDYHHGNGTEWAFYKDPSVLFFSTHDQFAYPGTGSPLKKGEGAGKGFNINVHLDCGCDDEMIMTAFKQHLSPVLKSFKPELILISAGFDSRKDDLLGCFSVTDQGFYQLTRWVMAVADDYCDGKVVSLLEGGYNLEGNASAVISHLQALTKTS